MKQCTTQTQKRRNSGKSAPRAPRRSAGGATYRRANPTFRKTLEFMMTPICTLAHTALRCSSGPPLVHLKKGVHIVITKGMTIKVCKLPHLAPRARPRWHHPVIDTRAPLSHFC